jgi:hypothetical protein
VPFGLILRLRVKKGMRPPRPASYSGVEQYDDKLYFVLKNVNGILAVYRVRNDGLLKRLQRWPGALEPLNWLGQRLRSRPQKKRNAEYALENAPSRPSRYGEEAAEQGVRMDEPIDTCFQFPPRIRRVIRRV